MEKVWLTLTEPSLAHMHLNWDKSLTKWQKNPTDQSSYLPTNQPTHHRRAKLGIDLKAFNQIKKERKIDKTLQGGEGR